MGFLEQVIALICPDSMEWILQKESLPEWPENMELVRSILKYSSVCPDVFLVWNGGYLYHHDRGFNIYNSLNYNINEVPINNKNEIVDPSLQLNSENFKKICVILELLVFKCSWIYLENCQAEYLARSEKFSMRLRRLQSLEILDTKMAEIGLNIFKTRNQFAHSMKSIGSLTYFDINLDECWGKSGTIRQLSVKRKFLEDAYNFSACLLSLFVPQQHRQINRELFERYVRFSL